MASKDTSLLLTEQISSRIVVVRGLRVILDADLALLYAVETKVFNQAIKRNLARFPSEFMFQLTNQEVAILRSQIVTSSSWGGRRYMPYAFTEHGALMAATVLNSQRAIDVSVFVVRAFVALRHIVAANADIAQRPKKVEDLTKYHDIRIDAIVETIDELMKLPARKPKPPAALPPKRQIGF